jgi:molybdopterin molybdotransferase
MSTGDELQPPETQDLGPGMIRDSNRFLLRALLEEVGATVVDLGIVGDDVAAFRSALAGAAGAADVVVTSGGVSMGDHDVVKEELLGLGSVEFWRVAMQPAKPFGFGSVPGPSGPVPFFGLPGNPVSVVVDFEQFLRHALLSMMGATALFRPRIDGVLEDGAHTDPEKDVFLRVAATHDAAGAWTARSAGGQSSNVLSALAAANAFAVVPRGVADVAPGGTVSLELFRHPSTRRREEALGDG